ncbi:protein containg AAA domain [Longilinea arvoryzae]|uniref:Protein containg AAA domain n=1 Tax=Longilinea arvoryzae TaxID=360412 RepID=A0A0S7BIH0_9CHLR|nr:MoxR family ATPase [Longilinea arvoryzae]GAP14262.1 protein containg AAA domain [Longilinea arvoryzae]
MLDFLRDEGINDSLIAEIARIRDANRVAPNMAYRVPTPRFYYYGNDIWEESITALLCGENLLLVGPKATGKNVLAENLAQAFGRPSWDISFHVNTESSTLIGTDTFENGQVAYRHGPIYECAVNGGFGVLDEINMAKNESIAILHATLDYRRIIDVPGYDKITLEPMTRFIATMNYGYAGTRELNEALASRFMVIKMPGISPQNLKKLLRREFPNLTEEYQAQFIGLFQDLQKKCENSEISSKSVDLRGLLSSIHLMERGLEANRALQMGITNKSFDDFERQLVEDVIRLRIPEKLERDRIFSS